MPISLLFLPLYCLPHPSVPCLMLALDFPSPVAGWGLPCSALGIKMLLINNSKQNLRIFSVLPLLLRTKEWTSQIHISPAFTHSWWNSDVSQEHPEMHEGGLSPAGTWPRTSCCTGDLGSQGHNSFLSPVSKNWNAHLIDLLCMTPQLRALLSNVYPWWKTFFIKKESLSKKCTLAKLFHIKLLVLSHTQIPTKTINLHLLTRILKLNISSQYSEMKLHF